MAIENQVFEYNRNLVRMFYSQNIDDYGFNPNAVKTQLLDVAATFFTNQNSYQKQYNLLRFRLLFPEFPFPELLFSYSLTDSDFSDFQDIIKFLYDNYQSDDNNTKISQNSLSDFFRDQFQFSAPAYGLPSEHSHAMYKDLVRPFLPQNENGVAPELTYDFIPEYFCISTFPALFAHFSTEEYIHAATNFIIRHINDPLAPNLLSSFLLHSSLFRDRLLTTYISKLFDENNENLNGSTNPTANALLMVFQQAFEGCLSYLSSHHFAAINALREVDEDAAIDAVFNLFIGEIFNSWKHSSLISELGIFEKAYSRPNASSIHSIYFSSILDEMLHLLLSQPDLQKSILDKMISSSNRSLQMPTISTILYTNGFTFTLTVADYHFIKRLYEFEIKNKTPEQYRKDIKSFLIEMFCLVPRIKQYINVASIMEPKMRETSFQLTRNKKEDYKTLHVFLLHRMEGMKVLEMLTESAFNILELKEIEYARTILAFPNRGYQKFTTQYPWDQAALFCYTVLYQCCSKSKNSFLSTQNDYIDNDIMSLLKAVAGLDGAKILSTIQTCWKQMNNLNKEYCFTPEIIKGFSTISEAIERVSLHLGLAVMDGASFNFVNDYPVRKTGDLTVEALQQLQTQVLNDYVSTHSHPATTVSDIHQNDIDDDSIEELAQQFRNESSMIISLIILNDAALKEQFNSGIKQFRIGQKFDFLMKLGELIDCSFHKSDFASIEKYQLIYDSVISANQLTYHYFKANIIHIVSVFEPFLTQKKLIYPNFAPKMLERLKMLKVLFNVASK